MMNYFRETLLILTYVSLALADDEPASHLLTPNERSSLVIVIPCSSNRWADHKPFTCPMRPCMITMLTLPCAHAPRLHAVCRHLLIHNLQAPADPELQAMATRDPHLHRDQQQRAGGFSAERGAPGAPGDIRALAGRGLSAWHHAM